MATLFKGKTLKRMVDGAEQAVDAKTALKDKVVALYFSAHWCPPCRNFTPILKDFYEEVVDHDFEVVFVSFDHTAKMQNEYLLESHGSWCFIPFGDPLIKELSEKYEVQGIPVLIVIKPNGDVVTKNGRADVMGGTAKSPRDQLEQWRTICNS